MYWRVRDYKHLVPACAHVRKRTGLTPPATQPGISRRACCWTRAIISWMFVPRVLSRRAFVRLRRARPRSSRLWPDA